MAETDKLTEATAAAHRWLQGYDAYRELTPGDEAEHLARTVLEATGWRDDQPLPLPVEGAEGAHDRVIDYLMTADLWRFHRERGTAQFVVAGLTGRKAQGLREYRTLLQAGNGRDAGGDYLTEVLDALAYAQVGYDEAIAAGDRVEQVFWWGRRNAMCDQAMACYERAERRQGRVEPVELAEGDEAALAVTRDRS